MFSISCSFWEILAKSYVGPQGLNPPAMGNPGSAPGMQGYICKSQILLAHFESAYSLIWDTHDIWEQGAGAFGTFMIM